MLRCWRLQRRQEPTSPLGKGALLDAKIQLNRSVFFYLLHERLFPLKFSYDSCFKLAFLHKHPNKKKFGNFLILINIDWWYEGKVNYHCFNDISLSPLPTSEYLLEFQMFQTFLLTTYESELFNWSVKAGKQIIIFSKISLLLFLQLQELTFLLFKAVKSKTK